MHVNLLLDSITGALYLGFYSHISNDQSTYIEHVKYGKTEELRNRDK